jgi:hypothetical protein
MTQQNNKKMLSWWPPLLAATVFDAIGQTKVAFVLLLVAMGMFVVEVCKWMAYGVPQKPPTNLHQNATAVLSPPMPYVTLKVLCLAQRSHIIEVGTDHFLVDGSQIPVVIINYLRDGNFLMETSRTEMKMRTFRLSEEGIRFREAGLTWWSGLPLYKKLFLTIFS